MHIISLQQIQAVLPKLNLIPALEEGFVAYSTGNAVVPPIGELLFQDPQGDVHIKYGYLQRDPYYVVKIVSGFSQNAQFNLPLNNGLMLLFYQKTGELCTILLDEGYLTEVRTALAGAIAAKHLAPRNVQKIGIVGTGIQARFQLRFLQGVTECREVMVWGRSEKHIAQYRSDMEKEGFTIGVARTLQELGDACNLIVTTTSTAAPLIQRAYVCKGTHITAMGADMASKQELDPAILRDADLVVADSIEQCSERGEIAHALRQRFLERSDIAELGQVIVGSVPGRTQSNQITVADLTGVAVQDIQIAKAVYETVALEQE